VGEPSPSSRQFVDEVIEHLNYAETWTEVMRENPILLAGSGRTVDQLPPPPSRKVLWDREHGKHHQNFLVLRINSAPELNVMAWGCMDCRSVDPVQP
jgi:hypothetical protein